MTQPMEIKADTTYLIRTDDELTRDSAERILEVWHDNVPESTRLIVLDNGLELSELSDEKLKLIGLRRI